MAKINAYLSGSISITLLICLAQVQHQLCLALSPASATLHQQQQQQQSQSLSQSQSQAQQFQPQWQKQQTGEENLLKLAQILKLTSAPATDGGVILGDSMAAPKKHRVVVKSAKLDVEADGGVQGDSKKLALKRKWHKMVDDLIDSSNLRPEKVKSKAEMIDDVGLLALGEPITSKMQPSASDSGQLAAPSEFDSKDDKLIILIKRRPTLDETAGTQQQQSNDLDDLSTSESQQTQSARRSPVDLSEHGKAILEDKFNIRRDSVFTTNNHLGRKEPPKFGSEVQF